MAEISANVPAATTGATTPVDGVGVTSTNSAIGAGQAFRQVAAIGDGTTAANIATVTAGGLLKVDGSSVTQPVSGTVTINPLPTGSNTIGNVGINGTVAVTGTFFQATQPISGSVSVSNFPATQPISGTVSINTIPAGSNLIGGTNLVDSAGTNKAAISAAGALKVDNSAVTQPVSGTFWPATQPVSIATMPSTPVTGTFWQATQPVSGSVSVSNFPASQAVTGTFWQATQPISGTVTVNALPTGANTIGNVGLVAGSATIGTVNIGSRADTVATGTITATDAVVAAPTGNGALLSGASTAGSLVSVADPGGLSAWNVLVTGLTSGTLYFEESSDSTTGTDGNWVAVNGRQTGVVNNVLGYSTSANGIFKGNASGTKYFRVRAVGALSGTPSITIRLSSGVAAVFLNGALPTGTNNIGGVTLVDSAGTNKAAISAAGAIKVDNSAVTQPVSGNVTQTSNNDAASTTAVAAGTSSNTVIKASAGRLVSILVTATGTSNVLIYDNASTNTGTIIGAIASTATVGQVIVLAAPAANGITVAGAAANAGFTVMYK